MHSKLVHPHVMLSHVNVYFQELVIKEVVNAIELFDFPRRIEAQEVDVRSGKTQPFGRFPLGSREESVIELKSVKCPMNAPGFRTRGRWIAQCRVLAQGMNCKQRRGEVFGEIPYDFLVEADQLD